MNVAKFFHLEGHGYLENIFYHENKYIARLKVIHEFQQENIVLECEVQGMLEDYFVNLEQAVKKGHSVIVSFKAVYCKCKTVFHCADFEGKGSEEQIIVLGRKLFGVRSVYVNGSMVDKPSFPYLAAA